MQVRSKNILSGIEVSTVRNEKYLWQRLRAFDFIGVETAALTIRTKQYSTSYSSHICYGKRFCNDFFLNHNTIALVRNCLKLLSCVVIETALDGMKKNSGYFSLNDFYAWAACNGQNSKE